MKLNRDSLQSWPLLQMAIDTDILRCYRDEGMLEKFAMEALNLVKKYPTFAEHTSKIFADLFALSNQLPSPVALDISGCLLKFHIEKKSVIQKLNLCIESPFEDATEFDRVQVVFIFNSSEVLFEAANVKLMKGKNDISCISDSAVGEGTFTLSVISLMVGQIEFKTDFLSTNEKQKITLVNDPNLDVRMEVFSSGSHLKFDSSYNWYVDIHDPKVTLNIQVPFGFDKLVSLQISFDQMNVVGNSAPTYVDDTDMIPLALQNDGRIELGQSFERLRIDIPVDKWHQDMVVVRLRFESFYFAKELCVRQREHLSLTQELIPFDGRVLTVLQIRCLAQAVQMCEAELLDSDGNSLGLVKKDITMHQKDLFVTKLELNHTDSNLQWVVRYISADKKDNVRVLESKLAVPSGNAVVTVWLEPVSRESGLLVYTLRSDGADEIQYELIYDAEEWVVQGRICGILRDNEPIVLCPLRRKDLMVLPSIRCKSTEQTLFEYPSNAQIIRLDH
jgi:hypothetical protein